MINLQRDELEIVGPVIRWGDIIRAMATPDVYLVRVVESAAMRDMVLRATNAAPCEIDTQIMPYKAGTWPYGVMIFWEDPETGQVQATFGDLTIRVNAREMLRLIQLCRGEARL